MSNIVFSLRILLRRKLGFTFFIAIILALGIGANTAIYRILDATLSAPMPFRDANSIVIVSENHTGEADSQGQFSAPNFISFREATKSFAGFSAFTNASLNLNQDGRSECLRAGRVSADFFRTLGVVPIMGRDFLPEEEIIGNQKKVLLSYELWKRFFDENPGIIGTSIRLDSEPWLVVGVLPQGFSFPYHFGPKDVYVPLAFTDAQKTDSARGDTFFSVVSRLKPGNTTKMADLEMQWIIQSLAKKYRSFSPNSSAHTTSLRMATIGVRRIKQFLLLATVSVIIYLIACINVTNIMIARYLGRRKELSVRVALGAKHWDLYRLIITENMVITSFGGILGFLFSFWFTNGMLLVLNLPTIGEAIPSPRVLVAMAGVVILTGVIIGSVSSARATRGNLLQGLAEDSHSSGSRQTHEAGNTLIIAEIALSASLLLISTLTLTDIWQSRHAPLGFNPKQLITANIHVPKTAFPNPDTISNLAHALVDQMKLSPGIANASVSDSMPMSGNYNISNYLVIGAPHLPKGQNHLAYVHHVTPGYFSTLQTPFIRGRDFTWQDGSSKCIISSSLANKHFQNQNPLGRILQIGGKNIDMEVIGVVKDTIVEAPGERPFPQLYCPYSDASINFSVQAIARTIGGAQGAMDSFKHASTLVDKDIPIRKAFTVEELVGDSKKDNQVQGILYATLALLASTLAIVGVYGLTSLIVYGRSREIGIRIACGATIQDILLLIMTQGGRLSLLGIGLGLCLSLPLGNILNLNMSLFALSTLFPLLIISLVLLSGTLLACLIPTLFVVRDEPSRIISKS